MLAKKKISSAIMAIIIVIITVFVTSCTDNTTAETTTAETTTAETIIVETTIAEVTEDVQSVATTKNESMTVEQMNALDSAKNYLSFMAFSYKGLVEQLEFEKYSHEDAVFAADNCGADWNEQAAKSAKNYLSFMSFSRASLIEQLEFEGFTHAQAVYGAEANGY